MLRVLGTINDYIKRYDKGGGNNKTIDKATNKELYYEVLDEINRKEV
jgi:hypothetical protein